MQNIIGLIVFIICGAVGIYFLAMHFQVIMAIIGAIMFIGFIISVTSDSPKSK